MVLAQIHNRFSRLAEAERRIASAVLAAPERATQMTAKELAQSCSSSPAAVIRFCKSLGFSGFSAFKIALAQDLGRPLPPTEDLPAFERSDSPRTVFSKVFASGIRTLRDTLEMIDFAQVESIARLFLGAGRIYIFGVGTSSVIAIDAQYRFMQLGLDASACTDVLFMNVAAINMQPGDVALCISHSGRTKAVVDAMRHARQAGAAAVAITSFADSLLSRESDHCICAYADEKNYPVEAVSARMAHMCVIDALMMTFATMRYDSFCDHIASRNAVLRDIRY